MEFIDFSLIMRYKMHDERKAICQKKSVVCPKLIRQSTRNFFFTEIVSTTSGRKTIARS